MNGGNIVIRQTLLDVMKDTHQSARNSDDVSSYFCLGLQQVLDTP